MRSLTHPLAVLSRHYAAQQTQEAEETVIDWSPYATDPEGFVRRALSRTVTVITPDQIRVMRSILEHQETNVQAAHGVGKTAVASWLVLWWVFAVKGLAISTAPTFTQVKELLWSEVRRHYDAAKGVLGGDRNELSVKLTETARGYGFSTRDYDTNAFQGRHAAKMLLIQDEACGISATIDDAFESCLTGTDNRALRIGNPVTPGTPFDEACKRRHIRIPVWGHPNVAWAYEQNAEGVYELRPDVAATILNPEGEVTPQTQWPPEYPRDVIPGAVSVLWIENVRHRKGVGSGYWQSRVDGYFPEDAEQSLVPRSWFLAAKARYQADREAWDNDGAWNYGLDVGDGQDPHAIAALRGSVVALAGIKNTRGDRLDTMRAASWALGYLRQHPGQIFVDRVGVGSGTLGTILNSLEAAHDAVKSGEITEDDADFALLSCAAFGVAWGASARGKKARSQYANLKAQQCWMLREAFREGVIAVSDDLDPDIEEMLIEELAGIYWDDSADKIRIEDKKKTRERIGRSPNIADALIMAYSGLTRGGIATGNL